MRQIIIARKDLNMSPGKLAAQCCHASLAFLAKEITKNAVGIYPGRHNVWDERRGVEGKRFKIPQHYKRTDLETWAEEARQKGENYFFVEPVDPNVPYGEFRLCEKKKIYRTELNIDSNIYEDWFNGIFTKTICEAKNKTQLMKAAAIAEVLGLKEGEDFFLIKDACLTELEPEEIDDNGIGRVLTCIGFKPLPDDIAHQISKKFQLYK